MRIAYLVNQYPAISHTFIRREIQALERQGVDIARYSVRRPRSGVISAEDRAEEERTRYILGAGPVALAVAALRSGLRLPLKSLSALASALRLGSRSEAGLLRHLFYWGEAMALADWLNREGLAHIHAHFGTNSAMVALLASRINGGGFSLTAHGPEEFDKAELIALPEKLRAARFSAAISNFGASQLRRLVSSDYWDRIKIVRCGVDRGFYENRATPVPDEKRFVAIGRLAAQKGWMSLVEAAAALKTEGREFTVTLVGDGELRGEIERGLLRLDVADRFELRGWLTPDEVRTEIARSRALVLPSYAEGLPVSIMEAFALERPVISTFVAGIPELVTPGESGWLTPAGDAGALAAAMREALDAAPAELERMGCAGKRRVIADHDIDRIASGLKALFEKATGSAAPA